MLVAIIILLAILVIGLGIVGYFLIRAGSFSRAPEPTRIFEESLSNFSNTLSEIKGVVGSVMPATQERIRGLEGSFNAHLSDLGNSNANIREKLSSAADRLEDIYSSQRGLEKIFTTPQTRGAWSELSLESVICDILPPTNFGIRKKISGTDMVPDAHIITGDIIICIDAKFPLDRFIDIIDPSLSPAERAGAKKTFKKNVKYHLEKIRKDYIREEHGTAPFAICYLPSEQLYYYLISEEFDLVREYALNGVQMVSPLTLVGKLEMIKSGISARKMSNEILEVQKNIAALESGITTITDVWKTLYGHHVQNLVKKSDEMDKALTGFVNTFERVK